MFGSRPDGWWNDRDAAAARLAQAIAEWCRTHADDVTVVFDAPLSEACVQLAGGNLTIVESERRGRNAADDTIVRLADADDAGESTVVTSDRGLRGRLPDGTRIVGAGSFLSTIDVTERS